MSANSAWPPQPGGQGATADHHQPFGGMDGIGEQDFASLLDFESFDFLSSFDNTANNNTNNTSDSNGGEDGAGKNGAGLVQHHHQQQNNGGDGQGQGQRPQQVEMHTPQHLFELQMSQMGFGQPPTPTQQQQHGSGIIMQQGNGGSGHVMHHQMVPPTPNSVEMHGDVGRYLQQLDAQTRAIIEHEYKMRQQDAMNFTPLGTPAVTPHDAQFNPASQFAVPGEYFSPLVSPALEGQQARGQHTTASTASTASPVDFDMDLLGESATNQQTKPARRTRRQSASTRSAGAGSRKVAQSPIQKPNQKRKSGLSSVIPPKEVTELLEMHAQSRMSPTSPASASRFSRAYASSSDSISPEPLSEGLMRPPPKPRSAHHSPAILASSKSPNVGPNGVGTMPATPASLMRLNKDSPSGLSVPSTIHEHQHGDTDMPMLEDLILPEAAAPPLLAGDIRSQLPSIDTAAANGDATPRVSARRSGSKSGPLMSSTPTTARPSPLASAVTSPIATAAASPMLSRRSGDATPIATPKSSSGGGGGGRTSKKRGSGTHHQLVSPALLPRISPSIKPLLPSGTSISAAENLTDEQHALLLTSRSNYQNLIEGRNIPGVTYPSDLPSQLTSKRTSHKIAEQGRRQRINVALQEMQGLLPKCTITPTNNANNSGSPSTTKIEDDDDDDDDDAGPGGSSKGKKGGKGGGNSKAATVEHAIRYIRDMQEKEAGWTREREEKEREVEMLRRKLDALERRFGSSVSEGASASPASEGGAGAAVVQKETRSEELETSVEDKDIEDAKMETETP